MGTIDHQSSISADTNNNHTSTVSIMNTKKTEKYSLRKRHKRGMNIIEADTEFDEKNNNVQCLGHVETTLGVRNSKTKSNTTKKDKTKAKTKAEPLSKYRRKTANARERTRMREINSAFETLRNCVPVAVTGSPTAAPNSPSNEKLTKITTLRLAMKYITLLSESLKSNRNDICIANIYNSSINTNLINNSDKNKLNGNNNKISVMNNNINITTPIKKTKINNINNSIIVKPIKLTKSLTASTRKKTSSSLASKKLIFPPPLPPLSKKCQSFSPSSSSSLSTSPSLLPTLSLSSPTSLQASSSSTQLNDEIFTSYQKYLDSDFMDQSPSPSLYYDCHTTSLPSTTTDSNYLEFGLILESDGESLQFSEPCLSPLAPLDGLSPFSDILSPNFSEQSTLDMYLT